MSNALHILFINRYDRVDRRAHMEGLLTGIGLPFNRVVGEVYDKNDLANPDWPVGAYGCWRSHERALAIAASRRERTIILEDDVVMKNLPGFWLATHHFNCTNVTEWDCVYYHGLSTTNGDARRCNGVMLAHAYLVHPHSAYRMLLNMTKYRKAMLRIRPAFSKILYHVDSYYARSFQYTMKFFATENLIVQDRDRWGSDIDPNFKAKGVTQ